MRLRSCGWPFKLRKSRPPPIRKSPLVSLPGTSEGGFCAGCAAWGRLASLGLRARGGWKGKKRRLRGERKNGGPAGWAAGRGPESGLGEAQVRLPGWEGGALGGSSLTASCLPPASPTSCSKSYSTNVSCQHEDFCCSRSGKFLLPPKSTFRWDPLGQI